MGGGTNGMGGGARHEDTCPGPDLGSHLRGGGIKAAAHRPVTLLAREVSLTRHVAVARRMQE